MILLCFFAVNAVLGYYLGQMKRMKMKRKERLVGIANELSASMGFRKAPVLTKNTVKKMGLLDIDGLSVKVTANKSGSPKQPKVDGRKRLKPKRRRN